METTEEMRERLPVHILKRIDTLDPHLNAATEQVNEALGPAKLSGFQRRVEALQRAPLSLIGKMRSLKRLASEFSAIVSPLTACGKMGKGCSHCCHIPVAITKVEAKQMALDLGITAKPAKAFVGSERQERFGYDYPCPFLKEGACSIYDQRPLACRIHFSMDADDLLCRLDQTGVPVPYMNVTGFQMAQLNVTNFSPIGDIRDFFPQGIDTK